MLLVKSRDVERAKDIFHGACIALTSVAGVGGSDDVELVFPSPMEERNAGVVLEKSLIPYRTGGK